MNKIELLKYTPIIIIYYINYKRCKKSYKF